VLFAYKVQLLQQLKPGDAMAHQHFTEEMLDRIDLDVDFLKKIMFTDVVAWLNYVNLSR
jgi:hypothetical protein